MAEETKDAAGGGSPSVAVDIKKATDDGYVRLAPASPPLPSTAEARAREGDDGNPFPYWRDPSRLTYFITILCDICLWPSYLIVGIPLDDFKLSGIIAALGAVGSICIQYFRYTRENSLRIWPKLHPLIMSLTWIAHGVWCAGVSHSVAQRYSLFFILTGVLLAGIVSEAANRCVGRRWVDKWTETKGEAFMGGGGRTPRRWRDDDLIYFSY